MSTAGPNLPASAVDRARAGGTWTNPSNAKVEDGSFATVTTASASGTHWLDCSSFSWPSNISTVSNLLVEVKCKIGSGTSTLGEAQINKTDLTNYDVADLGNTISTSLAWVTFYNANPPVGFDAAASTNTDLYSIRFPDGTDGNTYSVDAVRVTLTYVATVSGYTNLPLLGVGLVNMLIHGLTLGLCSWRWRPFTRTQTRTAGVMA